MQQGITRLLLAFVLSATFAACSAGSTGAPSITHAPIGDPNYAKLQFAVGTANIYGNGTIGLNVVSTLRQPNGTSATGVNTPAITGPFTLAVAAAPAAGTLIPSPLSKPLPASLPDPYSTLWNGGPSLSESAAATSTITGTPQSVHPGTPFCDIVGTAPTGFTPCPSGFAANASTFGESGGVFAMGLAPFNHQAFNGQAYSYAPYSQPVYDTGNSHALFVPWGGPPAFDPDGNGMGLRDGLGILGKDSFNLPYFLGVAEGVTAFEGTTPRTGTYTLSVQIGSLGNGGTPNLTTVTASTQLTSLTVLPTVTAPTVTPDANNDGGATLNVSLPGGVTEAYVQIVDYGPGAGPNALKSGGALLAANCQGPKGTAFAPVYYTIHVTQSGSFALQTNHGPNTNTSGGITGLTPSPSLCTAAQNEAAMLPKVGDNFTVQMIGFDYPIYQAALSLTQPVVPQTPPIAGASGQSDITISLPIEEDYPAYTPIPL